MLSFVCLTRVRGTDRIRSADIRERRQGGGEQRDSTARTTVLGNFMAAPLLPKRGTVTCRIAFITVSIAVEATACARPAQQTQRSDASDKI